MRKQKKLVETLLPCFEENMDNDLDVKTAFNKLFKTVDRLNRMSKQGKLSSEDAQKTITALRKIDAVLQVIF